MKFRIGVVIPTYERCTILNELLANACEFWEKHNIGVYIMDGSVDRETADMVYSYPYKNIYYKQLEEYSIGERILKGIEIADAEYICIYGDSIRPRLENYSKLFSALNKKYDLIDFTYRDIKKIGEKEYTDIVEMYRENTWDMTHMGNVFFRKESYKIFTIETYKERYNTEYFIQNAIYFDCYNGKHFRGFFCSCALFSGYNGHKEKKHGWERKVIEVAAYGWDDYVRHSDEKYDYVKKEVLLSHGMYSARHLNRYFSFIKLGIKNQFNRKIFEQYKESISRTSPLPIERIRLISKLPFFLLYPLYKAYILIKQQIRILGERHE